MAQAQTGSLKSTPKITKINGDDNLKIIYRNLGNNHAYPFVWAEGVTHSGTSTEIMASGTKFHGYDLVSYANVTATPTADPGAGRYWIDKNADGSIYIKSSASMSNVTFDVKFMLGEDPAITSINCRGNTGASQSNP